MTSFKPTTAATLECDMCLALTLHRRAWRESQYKCTACGNVNKRRPARRVAKSPDVGVSEDTLCMVNGEEVHTSTDTGKTWQKPATLRPTTLTGAEQAIAAALDVDGVESATVGEVESTIDAEHQDGSE